MGNCTFALLVARPAWQQTGHEDWLGWSHFDRLLLRMGVWSLIVWTSASVLGLWEQFVLVTERSLVTVPPLEELGVFLTDTQYGRVWFLRLLLAVLFGSVLLGGRRQCHREQRANEPPRL